MSKQAKREVPPQREIVLGDDFGAVAIHVNGTSLTFGTDGGFTLRKGGNEILNYTPASADASITVDPKTAYKVGDSLPDGWIVGPISPDTGKPVALEPVSGALEGYQTWHKGVEHAKQLRGQGNAGARQPSSEELNAIYNEVVKAGRNQNAQLNTSGSYPYGKYWSGTSNPDNRNFARVQYLGDGNRNANYKDDSIARVRVVRDEPGLKLA